MNEDWKPFWYKMYPAQFLSDRNIDSMTATELGAFTRLINRQFIDGYLPDDKKLIGRLARLNPEELEEAWGMLDSMFPVISKGVRANRFNKQMRDEAINEHNRRSIKTKQAVDKRWDNQKTKSEAINLEFILEPYDKMAFELIWDSWNKRADNRYAKGDRVNAERNFQAIINSGISSYRLYLSAEAYKKHPNVQAGFVRQISTFFDPQSGLYIEMLKDIPKLSDTEELKELKKIKEAKEFKQNILKSIV